MSMSLLCDSVLVHSRYLLKLSNSPAFLAEDLLRKPLALMEKSNVQKNWDELHDRKILQAKNHSHLCYKIAPLAFLTLQLHFHVFLVIYGSYSYNTTHISNDVLTKYCLNRLKIHDTIETAEEKLCMGLCMCFNSREKKCHWLTNDMNICTVSFMQMTKYSVLHVTHLM